MHRISVLILLFGFVFASDMEVMDRLEIYVNQEVEKRGEKFKKDVDRCFKIIDIFHGRKELDAVLKKEGCDRILKEYEDVIQKATEKYSEEIDKKFEEIQKRYKEKLKKARHTEKRAEVFLYKIQDLKIALIKLSINPEIYEIYDIKLTDRNVPVPYCTTDKEVWLFIPVRKSNLKYTIYYGKRDVRNIQKPESED
ncbi:MAG: hypothetical protein Q9M89_01800 [Persephonella sp.]|nr:hypothetical protein [Persephonella sp.]